MANLTLYGLKNCDTCKKAINALTIAGHDVTFVDIRSGADLTTKVPGWLSKAGSESLINKRSTTWRGLTEEEQERASGKQASELLIAKPTLIKRPVIEDNDNLYVGWTKEVSNALA